MRSYAFVEALAAFLRPDGVAITIECKVLESFTQKKLCRHLAGIAVIARDVGDIAEPRLVVLGNCNDSILTE